MVFILKKLEFREDNFFYQTKTFVLNPTIKGGFGLALIQCSTQMKSLKLTLYKAGKIIQSVYTYKRYILIHLKWITASIIRTDTLNRLYLSLNTIVILWL